MSRHKPVFAVFLAAGVVSSAGWGMLAVPAQERIPAQKVPAKPPPAEMTEAEVRAILARPAQGVADNTSLAALCDRLASQHNLAVRVDTAALKRLRPDADAAMGRAADPHAPQFVALRLLADSGLYDFKLRFPITLRMTVGDVLTEATAQLPYRMTYRVRGGQVLITPAYVPVTLSNTVARPEHLESRRVEHATLVEQMAGEPVSVALTGVKLTDAVQTLRRLTGANVVVGVPKELLAKIDADPVTATFDDVRLFTALEILGDLTGLKPALVGNVFYLTTPDRAAALQMKANRELFGEVLPPQVVSGQIGGIGGTACFGACGFAGGQSWTGGNPGGGSSLSPPPGYPAPAGGGVGGPVPGNPTGDGKK